MHIYIFNFNKVLMIMILIGKQKFKVTHTQTHTSGLRKKLTAALVFSQIRNIRSFFNKTKFP